MANELGYRPNTGQLVLSLGADWVCSLTADGETWPEGTTCWIAIDGVTDPWNATVSEETATASFIVQSTITDTILNKKIFRLYLRYPGTPTTEYLWFVGTVLRVDK